MENDSIITASNSASKVQVKKWDKLLDDYDNYVKEYLLHYKKSIKGNSASASIYPYMKVKSEDLGKKIFVAYYKSELTELQIKKMKKIHTKIMGTCC